MTPDERYQLGIKRLSARITRLRKRNPRPDIVAKAEISYAETLLENMADNFAKLQAARAARDTYNEQIDTHGRVMYTAALVVAERNIQHYEGLAPTDADLIGATA